MESFDLIKITIDSNCYSKGRNTSKISAIILHSFGQNLEEIIPIFQENEVSAHYLIPQMTAKDFVDLLPNFCTKLQIPFPIINLNYPDQVPVIQLVEDEDRAYHAGISNFGDFHQDPNSSKSLNPISLGIEFQSLGYGKEGKDFYHFSNFSEGQKETGIKLIKFLVEKYFIHPKNILAHSTIAVGRKTDPGPNFFWQDLYEAGLISLPPNYDKGQIIENPSKETIALIQKKLQNIGFINCLETGLLDKITQDTIDAYLLQFASNLWEGPNNDLSEGFLASLDAFAN
jgi:N-acetyl-anhydromuramyl-L-alanine amidase AmpD